MMNEKRVAFNTLGCKLNQYESDALASKFLNSGYNIVPFDNQADVYIINGCTVTNKADRKTQNILNRSLRQDQSMVVITGCFVDSHREELERDGRSFVVANEHKNNIFELVDSYLRGEIVHPEALSSDRFGFDAPGRIFRTRGMVKIQDGCDNFCSFCIIPYVRGRAISRSRKDIVHSARQMIQSGYRELVLTGVNMSRYNDGRTIFSMLLEELLELEGDYRLRISSLEPDHLDDRFIYLLGHERMTANLHLCLQSGSEKILLKMRRQYSYRQYLDIVENIRESYPSFNITTDLIVGFPGEEESDFNESLHAVREIGFGHVHVFKFSLRAGTRAARMPDQVSEKIKTNRSERIRVAAEVMKRCYRQSLIGQRQRVLVERVEKAQDSTFFARGLGEYYVPIRFQLPKFPDLTPIYNPITSVANERASATSSRFTKISPGIINRNTFRREEKFENNFLSVLVSGIDEGDNPDLIAEIVP